LFNFYLSIDNKVNQNHRGLIW